MTPSEEMEFRRAMLEPLRELIYREVIRPIIGKLLEDIVRNAENEFSRLGMIQFRFPRSKKQRIRRKWRSRIENWRSIT